MTKLLLLTGLLAGSLTVATAAPHLEGPGVPLVLTVKAAREAPGTTVTVRAVVLNGAEMGNIRYVQDSEADLALYAQAAKLPGFGELRADDSIQVTAVTHHPD